MSDKETNDDNKNVILKGEDSSALAVETKITDKGLEFNPLDPRITNEVPRIHRDLTVLITNVLVGNNVPNEIINKFNTNPIICSVRDKDEIAQRYAINKYWRFFFLYFDAIDTRRYRLGIVDDGSAEEWLDMFESISVPGILLISQAVANLNKLNNNDNVNKLDN